MSNVLVTFASWEERFVLGTRLSLKEGGFGRLLVFYLDEYSDRTKSARAAVEGDCARLRIAYRSESLRVGFPSANWLAVVDIIRTEMAALDGEVMLDISTMPREIIWYLLWVFRENVEPVRYVYHSPASYASDWLSRDPRAPRLVYKLSGVSRPDAKTALLITVGFDPDRARRLVSWLEPDKLLFGVQVDSPFEKNQATMADYRKALSKSYDCHIFEVDAFADDRGRQAVESALQRVKDTHNTVMASLGPKMTAIALFEIHMRTENTALVYTPSNQFNEEYSHGIGRRYEGAVKVG